jgi:hypothetical protein
MRTRKDAERVVSLCDQCERLHTLAAKIRNAETVGAYAPPDGPRRMVQYSEHRSFEFVQIGGELRELVKREVAEQIAVIDRELETLGIAPDSLGLTAPSSNGELTVYSTGI